MHSILSFIIAILILLSVAFMLWRHRTRNLSHISARLDSYWDTLKDRRKFGRFERLLNVECRISGKADDVYHAFSHDISGEGICIQVPEIMPEKSQVDLNIRVPNMQPIAIKGEVVWVDEIKQDSAGSERIFKAGIKFLKIGIKDKALLNKFIGKIAEENT